MIKNIISKKKKEYLSKLKKHVGINSTFKKNLKNLQNAYTAKLKNISKPNFQNQINITKNYIKNKYSSEKIVNFLENQVQKPKQLLVQSQDWLEQKVKNRENDVLLSQTSYWASSITWTLMGGTAFGIIWLGFAKTEEIVIAQGKLEPINNVVEVQIPIGGVVETILAKEGEYVSKDQILLKLNKETPESRFNSSKEILELNKNILKKFEFLLEEGAISEIQLIQQKIRVSELENNYVENKFSLTLQDIKAPISGKIFDLKPSAKGFVGTRSEPIMKIVPVENLSAKIEINSNSIGFVKTGMKTDISIDSFPASDFGVIQGTVKSIGSDALPPEPGQGKGYRFPATISLDTQTLKIKNGNELPLTAGMSLTANVKLRKVSYLQLLLGTFQDKAKSLREI